VRSGIRRRSNLDANKLVPEDRPAHDWYRFVLSFPPHLVRDYLNRFGIDARHVVLDPFCGTGTTVVECKKLGIPSVGIEANPMAHLASSVKVDWTINPSELLRQAATVSRAVEKVFASEGIQDEVTPALPHTGLRSLDPESMKLLLTNSISPLPLHKTLTLLDRLERSRNGCTRHASLALAKALVQSISNLHFGPEVGVGTVKADAPVLVPWMQEIQTMAENLRALQECKSAPAIVQHADSRRASAIIEPGSIDAVITSPPYPNEKDYTRTTRLESVLLGLVRSKQELRALKKGLVRSNTRGVYKTDDDHLLVAQNANIQKIAAAIEARRLELGKTSGFERLYAKVTKLYFGGIARHLMELRSVLRPGARLAYVVGDQASYLRVMIRTGQLLAEIAESVGYKVLGIDLFRTRLATATREQLREEVVLLQWNC
jgi:tRNA G10  N-methylase Trm11